MFSEAAVVSLSAGLTVPHLSLFDPRYLIFIMVPSGFPEDDDMELLFFSSLDMIAI